VTTTSSSTDTDTEKKPTIDTQTTTTPIPPDNSEAEKGVVNPAASTDESNKEKENEAPASPPPRTAQGFVWLLVVSSILMANFLFATDNTIAANIQPAVIRQFESLDKLAWLGVAFLAACWGTNFFWGDMYARFSAKWTFCASFVVFSVGCALAGAAPSMDALIVGRAICGMGGAGM
jgi:hypothetical protein